MLALLRRPSGLVTQAGPGARRVVLHGQPEHRLSVGEAWLVAHVPREVAVAVGPDHLADRRPDVAVELFGGQEHGSHPPAVVDVADRQPRGEDVADLIANIEALVVGGPRAQRPEHAGELAERSAEGGQVRVTVTGPQADAVGPRRRIAIAEHARDGPAAGADLAEDPLHVGVRAGVEAARLPRAGRAFMMALAKLPLHKAHVRRGHG